MLLWRMTTICDWIIDKIGLPYLSFADRLADGLAVLHLLTRSTTRMLFDGKSGIT
jgi:hypothetical protein